MKNTDSHQPGRSTTKISLENAKIRIKKWLSTMASAPGYRENPDTIPRALFISLEDIKELIADYDKGHRKEKLVGVRVYIGLKELWEGNDEPRTYILDGLMVPVIKHLSGAHVDVVYQNEETADSAKTSIYDFTAPCPQYCDKSSELYLSVK